VDTQLIAHDKEVRVRAACLGVGGKGNKRRQLIAHDKEVRLRAAAADCARQGGALAGCLPGGGKETRGGS